MQQITKIILVIVVLVSCSGGKTLLYRINDKFAVYESASCHCTALYISNSSHDETLLLENVFSVLGNPEEFLVQTPSTTSTTWSLVKSAETSGEEDLIELGPDEVDEVLEKLQITFAKDYTEQQH